MSGETARSIYQLKRELEEKILAAINEFQHHPALRGVVVNKIDVWQFDFRNGTDPTYPKFSSNSEIGWLAQGVTTHIEVRS